VPDKITIKPRANHRVGVFVDMQNVYHSAKNLYGSRVNFNELLKLATQDRQIVRALVYVVKSDTDEERSFFDALEKSGLELKVKDLQIFAGGAKKADWDVGIAVDVISMAKQLDVVVLVTGDGDFVPLVDYLQHNGLIVEAVSFGRSTSLRLKETVNNYYDLDEHRKTLMRIPQRKGARSSRADAAEPEEERADATLTGMFMPSRNIPPEE
jgi:uncharacterized LabA/DUF88 family protein